MKLIGWFLSHDPRRGAHSEKLRFYVNAVRMCLEKMNAPAVRTGVDLTIRQR